MQFSFSTPREIARGLKSILESKMGTPSLARIIEDVDLALKALEIVYLANGASVQGLADRNGHRRSVIGEEKSVSCGGARTKGKGRECERTKKMSLHSDLLEFCLKKKPKINDFFPDTTVFTIIKIVMQTNDIKRQRHINQLNLSIRTFDLR